ncbi:MAG: glycosyltransferase [Bacteroides sp.]|nr:glycosyltransferase [Bacteroides sp.]MCM1378739.1 glycosyltransferase [Bacteroides sp.]MCM1445356.1 glycosyltransferase [Prevotella sp.]
MLSVIIPTYNRAESLERTLTVLLQSDELPDEVLIIDQTTEPQIATRIADLAAQSPVIKLLHNDIPSLTMARNRGIDEAKGDVLVFMDDDVDVSPDTFRTLRHHFSENENLAMIAGLNEGEEFINRNSTLGLLFGRSSWRRRYKGHVTKAVYGRFPIKMTSPVETEWAMGFFFAVRRSLIDRYSLRFDEKLQRYAYAEDLDFTYRYFKAAQSEGLTCRMVPEIIVKHNVSTEYRIPSRLAVFQVVCHRRYLSHKLFGTASSRFACLWSDFGALLTAILHRENWRDYLDAIKHASHNKNEINLSNFHFENI